jgi:hypothetical protein
MDWKQEAERVLKLHEENQQKYGKSRDGRPDSVSGKIGWGIRDTAKLIGRSFRYTQEHIKWGLCLRSDPTFDNRASSEVSIKQTRTEKLLANIRTTIFVLKQDKRTVKIGNDLEKALKDYES